MWMYKAVEGGWETGYHMPDGSWFTDEFFRYKVDAANRVHWLNGGNQPQRGKL